MKKIFFGEFLTATERKPALKKFLSFRHSLKKLTRTTWVAWEARTQPWLKTCNGQLCMYKCVTYNFNLSPDDRFLRNLSWQFYFNTQSLLLVICCWEEVAERHIFCHISSWCLILDTNSGFTYNKPTHYFLDYGDFPPIMYKINTHNFSSMRS